MKLIFWLLMLLAFPFGVVAVAVMDWRGDPWSSVCEFAGNWLSVFRRGFL